MGLTKANQQENWNLPLFLYFLSIFLVILGQNNFLGYFDWEKWPKIFFHFFSKFLGHFGPEKFVWSFWLGKMTKNFFLFFGSFWAQKFFPVILGRKNNFVILSQKILFGHNDLFHWAKKRPKMTQNFFGQKRQNFGSFWAKRISVAQIFHAKLKLFLNYF